MEYTWTAEEAKALTDTTELVWRYDTLDSLMREVPVLDLQFVRDTGEKQELTDLLIRCPDGPEELAYLAGNPDEDYWLVTDDSGRIQLPLPLLAPDQMKGVIFTYDAKYRVKSLTGNGYTLAAEGTLTADRRTLTAEIPLSGKTDPQIPIQNAKNAEDIPLRFLVSAIPRHILPDSSS